LLLEGADARESEAAANEVVGSEVGCGAESLSMLLEEVEEEEEEEEVAAVVVLRTGLFRGGLGREGGLEKEGREIPFVPQHYSKQVDGQF